MNQRITPIFNKDRLATVGLTMIFAGGLCMVQAGYEIFKIADRCGQEMVNSGAEEHSACIRFEEEGLLGPQNRFPAGLAAILLGFALMVPAAREEMRDLGLTAPKPRF